MAKMVLGLFSEREMAEDAISELEENGYKTSDLSIIMKDRAQAKEIEHNTGANIAEGATAGATTGGLLGGIAGLLIGIGAIAVPGIGGLLIAGPIAAALGLSGAAATTVSGAITGALAGGLVGALANLGVPEEDARLYEERIKSGAILLAVPAAIGREDEAKEILSANGADQIRTIDTTERELRRKDREFVTDEYGTAYFSEVNKSRRDRK